MSSSVEITSFADVLAAGPPTFGEQDGAVWKARLVAKFEELSGRTLYEGQVEMFVIEAVAYMLALRGAEEQAVAEQNLILFATGAYLDARSADAFTYRLLASSARCTLRFTLAGAAGVAIIVPQGTRVGGAGGAVTFATETSLVIPAGQTSGEVLARAAATGLGSNGWAPGTITAILDPVAGVASAANIDVTGGGAELEDDERLRERAAFANLTLSQAGPRDGYLERVKGVNPAILDVAVIRPSPGVIEIYPLFAPGRAPTDSEREEIATALDPETVRPMGDDVFVLVPPAVAFDVALTVRVSRSPEILGPASVAAARTVAERWRRTLGGAVAPSEITAAVKALPGVVDCQADGLVFQALEAKAHRLVGEITADVVMVGAP
jgi:phage-related baseplate assembly protein